MLNVLAETCLAKHFAVQGPNFQRTDVVFAVFPAHALARSLFLSKLQGDDRLKMRSDKTVPST